MLFSLPQRLASFARLGDFLRGPAGQDATADWASRAHARNPWFTPAHVRTALQSLAHHFLTEEALTTWAAGYDLTATVPRRVGVVMAGNVPAVGFHDLLCTLVSGHTLLAKLSVQDDVLLPALVEKLVEIEPRWADRVYFVERLNDAQAVIATGSDNTARYFHYYFGHQPHLIRRNRTSVAVLDGRENATDLARLGTDVLTYFGLGCRNVSKLFVPNGYDFRAFFEANEPLSGVGDHHKYRNNYDYQKSVLLVNRVPHLDNGFMLLTENPALVSPVATVYFGQYAPATDQQRVLSDELASLRHQIQCVVTRDGWLPGSLCFGQTQQPTLTDYADGVDTLAFLATLPT